MIISEAGQSIRTSYEILEKASLSVDLLLINLVP